MDAVSFDAWDTVTVLARLERLTGSSNRTSFVANATAGIGNNHAGSLLTEIAFASPSKMGTIGTTERPPRAGGDEFGTSFRNVTTEFFHLGAFRSAPRI